MNAAAFISPFIGIAVAKAIGIPATLLIFAGVRFFGSLVWTLFPIDAPQLMVQPEGA